MDKKIRISIIAVFVVLLGGVVFFAIESISQKRQNQELQELAALEKEEMENEYHRMDRQYDEMIAQINNDSLVAQLTQEQLRTQQLLEELKQVKSSNAREITRLKKELATMRAVLQDYVMQIDSLNRLNQNLMAENTTLKDKNQQARKQIEGLSSEKETLSKQVSIAAQLDATNLQMLLKNKRGKRAKKIKDCKQIEVSFVVAKNVTATNGLRSFYVRINTPTGNVLSTGSTFPYQDRNIEYSMKKDVEYTGEELSITTYWNVNEYLSTGTYTVSIFSGDQMIGSRSFTFEK